MSDAIARITTDNPDLRALLQEATIELCSAQRLLDLSCGPPQARKEIILRCPYDSDYSGPKRPIHEVTVVRGRWNTIAANFVDPGSRKRHPGATMVCRADEFPTNKELVGPKYGLDFEGERRLALMLLREKTLAAAAFEVGAPGCSKRVLAILDRDLAYFAFHASLLQRLVEPEALPQGWSPDAVIYVLPEFRYSHFNRDQVVVHRRKDGIHEVWSFNLYPGPSAKKGMYGILLEGGVVSHCSVVVVETPYRNRTTFRHEGASGGGKSEMGMATPVAGGKLLLGVDQQTEERFFVSLQDTCAVYVAADDMHVTRISSSGRIEGEDAEGGHFLRLDSLRRYGDDPRTERLMFHPPGPLGTINIEALPGAQVLPWDHILDVPPCAEHPEGILCPNPRLMLPTKYIPGYIAETVSIDVASFGVRCPLTTKETPNYGILGVCQVVHPLLFWVWQLVAPRGSANPSIAGPEGLVSEGVGSYREFLIGDDTYHADLLLDHALRATGVLRLLIPNQHIGSVRTGFAPQWCCREYFARRHGNPLSQAELVQAPCTLLGSSLREMVLENSQVATPLLQPWKMLGQDAYDAGAEMLWQFFEKELQRFRNGGSLRRRGKEIIDYTLTREATWDGYEELMKG